MPPAAAIASAVQSLMLPQEQITLSYCDLNGERFRNEEFVFAQMRTQETGSAGDQYPAAQDGARPQCAQRGDPGHGQRRGVREVDSGGDFGHRGGVHSHAFGPRAGAERRDSGSCERSGAVRRGPYDDTGGVVAVNGPGRTSPGGVDWASARGWPASSNASAAPIRHIASRLEWGRDGFGLIGR